ESTSAITKELDDAKAKTLVAELRLERMLNRIDSLQANYFSEAADADKYEELGVKWEKYAERLVSCVKCHIENIRSCSPFPPPSYLKDAISEFELLKRPPVATLNAKEND